MSKEVAYQFIKNIDSDNEFSRGRIIVEVDDHDIYLPNLIVEFRSFLLGVGYGADAIDKYIDVE